MKVFENTGMTYFSKLKFKLFYANLIKFRQLKTEIMKVDKLRKIDPADDKHKSSVFSGTSI